MHWSLRALLVLAALGLAACDENEPPGCAEALGHYHDVAQCRLVLEESTASSADALAWCEDLRGPGCEAEHAALTTCLARANTATCDPCAAEQEVLLVCLGREPCDGGCPVEPTQTWLPPGPPVVDLLLVVDSSGGMAEEQHLFGLHLSALRHALESQGQARADLHVGVVSTDLGTAPYNHTYCEHSDEGRLLVGDCAYLAGAPYLIDVAPTGCETTRDATGWCTDSSCGQANCDGVEPGTVLEVDDRDCPRCINHLFGAIDDVVACLTGLGDSGCGFEQPLESLRLALDDHPANVGFLRERSVLGIVILADEDDCSAADPRLFDTAQTTMDSELGPRTSFRCFEHGITCDVDDREAVGPRLDCAPREDAGSLLHPLSRYRDFLRQLRDPDQLLLATITGPFDGTVIVGRDEYDYPEVQDSCEAFGIANPGIRLRALAESLAEPGDADWVSGPTCAPSYVTQLTAIGEALLVRARRSSTQCLPAPLVGCSDPGAADGEACNDGCAPACEVSVIFDRGLIEEHEEPVPPCLEVCAGGPCPGNADPGLAYAGGHPEDLDPALPVDACWHVRHDPECTASRGAAGVMALRVALPPRSFVSSACALLQTVETRCGDGLDDDGDCLVDGDDPDCN